MSGPMYTPFLPVGAPTGVFTPPVWTSLAPNSSTLAWRIPWTEKPGGLQSMGSLRVGHDWAASLSLLCIGGGNGNPLQCSCLENPRDRGAWWPVVCVVAQSWTWLKWLGSSSSLYLSMIVFLGCWLITNTMVISWKKCWRNRRNAPRLKIYDRDKHGTRNHQALLKRTLKNE